MDNNQPNNNPADVLFSLAEQLKLNKSKLLSPELEGNKAFIRAAVILIEQEIKKLKDLIDK